MRTAIGEAQELDLGVFALQLFAQRAAAVGRAILDDDHLRRLLLRDRRLHRLSKIRLSVVHGCEDRYLHRDLRRSVIRQIVPQR